MSKERLELVIDSKETNWKARYDRYFNMIGGVLKSIRRYRDTGEPKYSDVEEIEELVKENKLKHRLIGGLEKTRKDKYGEPLPCYGCSNSSSNYDGDFPFPGKSSGGQPCCFCLRNLDIDNIIKDFKKKDWKFQWYDGSKPIKVPMDCYRPMDMCDQIEEWFKSDKKEVESKSFMKELKEM